MEQIGLSKEKSKNRKIKKSMYNIITSLVYKVAVCVVGIIIPRFFIMSFGSEINGLQGSVSQIFTYIALLEAGVGAATLQALFGPVSKKDHDEANGILSATTKYYNKIGIIYFCVLTAVSLIYPLFVHVSTMNYFMVLLYILVSGATTGINFFYRAKIQLIMSAVGDNHYDSLVNLIVFLLTSAIKIVFILKGYNVVLIQTMFLIVNLLSTLCYYIIAKRRYPWMNFHEKPNIKAIGQKNSALVHKISSIIFQNVDVLLLTFMTNLKMVSIYTMYKMVINMIASIVGSFGDGINFIIGQSFNGEDLKTFQRKIDTFNVYYSALSFALYSTMYMLIIPFLRLYTKGMDLDYIIEWLPFLFVIIELLQVGREAMIRTINVAGRFKDTIYSTITETIINIVASVGSMLLFKYLWGETYMLYGALVGTIFALVYRTFDINYFANRKILNRSAWHSNKIILTNALFFVLVFFVSQNYQPAASNYLEFFLSAAIIAVCMLLAEFVLQSIMNFREFKYMLSIVRQMIKRK